MKIAILEDDIILMNNLKTIIEETAHKYKINITIDLFENGQLFIDNYQSNKYDCVYLDIEMPLLDGMSCAKQIRTIDSDIIIVFVTNHVQYAIEGYNVAAFDFLLKPINTFQFDNHFKKLLQRYNAIPTSQTITLKYKNQINKVNVIDILFIESHGHYLEYHLKDATYTTIDTLKNIQTVLVDLPFYRCNNHYLVNMNHVESIHNDQVIINNQQLQISRPRKKDFMNALTNFLANGKI